MALAATTLAAACTAEATSLLLTSATGTAAGNFLRVNDEVMYVQAITSTTVTVQRGRRGTLARAHGILSIVVTGLASEFADADEFVDHIYSYGAAGAITPRPGSHRLVAASAAAMTLAAPPKDMEGTMLTIVAVAAQAYTVTLDSGYFNGATNNIGTYGGAIGDVFTLLVIGGSYCVVTNKNVTLSA